MDSYVSNSVTFFSITVDPVIFAKFYFSRIFSWRTNSRIYESHETGTIIALPIIEMYNWRILDFVKSSRDFKHAKITLSTLFEPFIFNFINFIFFLMYVSIISKCYNIWFLIDIHVLYFLCFIFFHQVIWRPVIWGLGLQFILGILVLRWEPGYYIVKWAADEISRILAYSFEGASLVWGDPFMFFHPFFCLVNHLSNFFIANNSLLFYTILF